MLFIRHLEIVTEFNDSAGCPIRLVINNFKLNRVRHQNIFF
jgi:hypothetical protein